jgi:molybdopterin-containing oxidoreductase family iron-sulfur binding subunit
MKNGPRDPGYWRSLEEFLDPASVPGEDPHGVPWKDFSTATRRRFLQLMGASLGLAGLTGCRWPKEKISPYAGRPADRTPGIPEKYATAMELGGYAVGLLVTSFDGRPIKIDGNPSDPVSRGTSSAFHQAAVLQLYDPDRSRSLVRSEGTQTFTPPWEDFLEFARNHFGDLRRRGGEGLRILSEYSSSPTQNLLRYRFEEAFPEALWHGYEPLSRNNERAGLARSLGTPHRSHPSLDKAAVIVCLDDDPLATHPAALGYARDFAAGRDPAREMSRLYVVESSPTVTGAMADHRVPMRSSDIAGFAAALLAAVVPDSLRERRQELGELISEFEKGYADPDLIQAMAEDLLAHRGNSVVTAGPRQNPEVHVTVALINHLLENDGETIAYRPDTTHGGRPITELADAAREGSVETLVMLGGNPVYDAPADLEFAAALGKIPQSIHLSLYRNETSEMCRWHLPRAHFLESWGDAVGWDGTLYPVQPLIAPLYNGKTPIELTAIITGEKVTTGYELVRETFRKMREVSDFEDSWESFLREGVLPGSARAPETPGIRWERVPEALEKIRAEAEKGRVGTEIVFREDPKVYDGRFANNAWLQEMPDALTKLTWDNAALVAPETADSLNIETGDMIDIEIDGRKLALAVFVMPGQAPDSITVSLGYGRMAAGGVGNGVGFNAYCLRTTENMPFASVDAITATGERYRFACTQDHHSVGSFRGKAAEARADLLIRETDAEDYRQHPEFARHAEHAPDPAPLWDEHEYDGSRWGMVIDLNRCTGCSACVVACQAENNIPVVGKKQVGESREMHWIRVDRYFRGPLDNPEVAVQPLACVHCENAPCEQVCPVNATVHSEEGLNQMVYNRCVGTRYCSNNCPFKVRRFNFFNYHESLAETRKMLFNPEVTVRSRGVMEKCTYCVQRIQAAKIRAGIERRPVRDGEVVPACAEACPSGAIVFGDLTDPGSRVAELHKRGRAYELLTGLYLRGRTLYMARIRNPNPAFAKGNDGHQGTG